MAFGHMKYKEKPMNIKLIKLLLQLIPNSKLLIFIKIVKQPNKISYDGGVTGVYNGVQDYNEVLMAVLVKQL